MQGLERAWTALGGKGKLAKALSVSPTTISNWIARGEIPRGQVVKVETVSGVPRAQLHPDFSFKRSKSPKTK